jgi:hypothetical protein
MAATRFQKAFQTKRRTGEVDRLTKQFQQQTSGLLGEYGAEIEKKKSEYDTRMAEFNKTNETYKQKLSDYQSILKDIEEKRGDWIPVPIVRYRQSYRHGGPDVAIYDIPRDFVSVHGQTTFPSQEGLGGHKSFDSLGTQGIRTKVENGQGYVERQKRIPAPFTEKAPVAPEAPDLKMAEEMQTRKKSLSSDYEREIAERKAGRVGSVSKRAQSRPMLSKGVTV